MTEKETLAGSNKLSSDTLEDNRDTIEEYEEKQDAIEEYEDKQDAIEECKEKKDDIEEYKEKQDSIEEYEERQDILEKKKNTEKSGESLIQKEHVTSEDEKVVPRCGECVNCKCSEDCGVCDFCIKGKHGGPIRLRQACRQRQCNNSNLILWWLPNKPKPKEDKQDHLEEKQSIGKFEPGSSQADKDEVAVSKNGRSKSHQKNKSIKKSETISKNSNDKDEGANKGAVPKKDHSNSQHKRKSSKKTEKKCRKNMESYSKCSEEEKSLFEVDETPRQCFGPECIYAARPGSKYCSDACGRKLADLRLNTFLRNRTPSVADEYHRKSLEKIQKELQQVRDSLEELSKKRKELDEMIEIAKSTTISINQENFGCQSTELESTIYCVTCGNEFDMKTVQLHMAKCFQKYEANISFGGNIPASIIGKELICDFYDPKTKTYCKRLKIICPQHSKEPKVSDAEVCGCPLSDELKPTGEFCTASKKRCVKHYQWEKIRRAENDMEKVKIIGKLGALMELENSVRQQMANRGGVLDLLLNRTTCHDVPGPEKL